MKKIKYFVLTLCFILIQSCYFGANVPVYDKDLPGNLKIYSLFEKDELGLFEFDNTGFGYAIINPTIIEIGWTNDVIIARSHPEPNNIPKESELINFISGELENQADYIKFKKEHLVNVNGKWTLKYAHVKSGTDTIYPYKIVPFWNIIDVTNKNKLYRFISKEKFNKKRQELQIPDSLSFFLKLKKK
ncbi:MAG: hypothetical protein JKY02_04505 [Flavobacteriaceae bacterium]|nr:hypothetical protein [Flavobacteriaceae bacterium]